MVSVVVQFFPIEVAPGERWIVDGFTVQFPRRRFVTSLIFEDEVRDSVVSDIGSGGDGPVGSQLAPRYEVAGKRAVGVWVGVAFGKPGLVQMAV